jgi:hypothetical protein
MNITILQKYFSLALLIALLVTGNLYFAKAQASLKTGGSFVINDVKAATKGLSGQGIVQQFFKTYKTEGTANAIGYLFSTNKYFTDTAQIAELKRKMEVLKQSVGEYLGNELISQKNAGKSLYYFSYLVKFDQQPVRFIFMFYKPKNDWVIYHFKFDADLDTELEQAGKVK